jgi:hypothetical protein
MARKTRTSFEGLAEFEDKRKKHGSSLPDVTGRTCSAFQEASMPRSHQPAPEVNGLVEYSRWSR